MVSGPWIRRSRRVGYDNAWITVWHDEVTRPDGSPGIYGVVHFANLAAGVLALDDRDRVLLVGQHRYVLDAYSWEIPEGGVPDGESALDGARRELREETGVEAESWRELARVHLSNSVSDELAVLFLATGLHLGTATPDPTEALEVRWLPFEDVLAMTLDGRITDAMTVVAVERLALMRARTPPAAERSGWIRCVATGTPSSSGWAGSGQGRPTGSVAPSARACSASSVSSSTTSMVPRPITAGSSACPTTGPTTCAWRSAPMRRGSRSNATPASGSSRSPAGSTCGRPTRPSRWSTTRTA